MQVKTPSFKYEFNFNTLVMVVGFGVTTATWGVTWGSFRSDVRAMDDKFSSEIVRLDKRIDQGVAYEGKNDERNRSIELDVRKIENLTYRITVNEQTTSTLVKASDEMKTLITTVATDVKYLREEAQRNANKSGRSQ